MPGRTEIAENADSIADRIYGRPLDAIVRGRMASYYCRGLSEDVLKSFSLSSPASRIQANAERK